MGLIAGLAGSMTLSGCGKPPPPPPPPPPPRPSAAPAPEPVDTEALVQQVQADARVQFPNSVAPTSEELARAVIALADGFARGDAKALRPILDQSGVAVLDELQASGAWEETTRKIEAIRITSLNSGEDAMPSGDVTMAIQEPAAAYQLRWHATPSGTGYIFSPMESDGTIMARAGDFDGSSGAVEAAPVAGETPDSTKPGEGSPAGKGGGGPPTEAGG
jgi:hypothetical protein